MSQILNLLKEFYECCTVMFFDYFSQICSMLAECLKDTVGILVRHLNGCIKLRVLMIEPG